jgi:taurine dioxygenase
MCQTDLIVRSMTIGAEIAGLSAGSELTSGLRQRLYAAWLEHGFLLFRGIDSIERHLALSRCFGELEIHPVPEARHPDSPSLIELGGPRRGAAYVFDGADLRVNRIAWHRDTAYSPDICKGAMLRMVEIPTLEGETMLADTAKAYDELPQAMKRRLEGLEYKATIRTDPMNTIGRPGVFWDTVRPATEAEDPGSAARRARTAGIDDRYPSVIHPAVLTHPESGRKCIFLSPTYVDHFIGMDGAESDTLLRALVEHMLQPRYVYKHKWRVNDAIIWDNRRCMHAGMGNLPGEPRYGLRTTLAGPLRTGRYSDAALQGSRTTLLD